MAYRLEVAPEVVDTLRSLPRKVQRQIARRIDALAEDPRPAGCKKLGGEENLLPPPFG